MLRASSAYLRETLETLSRAAGVPIDAEYGPRCNGLLLDDLILWIESVRCRHCGNVGASGEDHTCSCPLHDNDCTTHPSLSMAAQAAPADDQEDSL
jgi:hypothetical protein